MLPARPATGDLYAVSVSNRAIAAVRVLRLRVCLRLTCCEYRNEEQGSGRFLDGLGERFVGRGYVGCRRDRDGRGYLVRPGRRLSQRRVAPHRTLHSHRTEYASL